MKMKKIRHLFVAMLLAMVSVAGAQAQFRFGVKAGVAVNKLSFDKSTFDSDNRAGFTGGVMAEFTVPVINLGFDASVLYAQRSVDVYDNAGNISDTDHRGYIDIPINFKWKMSILGTGKIIAPFLTTGPDFSFLCSKQNFKDAWNSRKFDFAWNIGAGVQLLNKIQVAASYGFGLTNSANALHGSDAVDDLKNLNFKGKNRSWTITLAYLF